MKRICFGCSPLILLLVCSCGSPAAPEVKPPNITPVKENTTAARDMNNSRGKEIFETRCADCHGLSGNKRNNGAADLQLSRIDSLSIAHTIINGKGAMPMFDHVMPDSDLAQLELYVKSLRRYE